MDTDNSRALVSTDVDKVMAVVEATGLSKAKLAQVKATMDELKLSMLSIIDSVDIKLSELDTKLKKQEASTDQLKQGRDDDIQLIKRLAKDVSGLVIEKNKAACAAVADCLNSVQATLGCNPKLLFSTAIQKYIKCIQFIVNKSLVSCISEFLYSNFSWNTIYI